MRTYTIEDPLTSVYFANSMKNHTGEPVVILFNDCGELLYYQTVSSLSTSVKQLTIILCKTMMKANILYSVPRTVKRLIVQNPNIFDIPETVTELFILRRSTCHIKDIPPATIVYSHLGKITYQDTTGKLRTTTAFMYQAGGNYQVSVPFVANETVYIEKNDQTSCIDDATPPEKNDQKYLIDDDIMASLFEKSNVKHEESMKQLASEIYDLLKADSEAGTLYPCNTYEIDISKYGHMNVDLSNFIRTKNLAFKVNGTTLQVSIQQ